MLLGGCFPRPFKNQATKGGPDFRSEGLVFVVGSLLCFVFCCIVDRANKHLLHFVDSGLE